MEDAWVAVIREAQRWEHHLHVNDYFEVEGDMIPPSRMLHLVQERILYAIPAAHMRILAAQMRWRRLSRHALLVGKMALYFQRAYNDVTFRPQHTGAKRCRDHFYLCAGA